jgi:type I restriction enzyme M protein
VKLLRLCEDGEVTAPIHARPVDAESRLDWAFHAHTSGAATATNLRELGADIRRGSLSTVERRAAQFEVFHTGDFPRVGETIKLPQLGSAIVDNKTVVAEAGDILIARVDRDLHNKITMIECGSIALTDCVYRVRLPEEHRKAVFSALASERGRSVIKAATKGVGARLLGKGELLNLPLHLEPVDVPRSSE